MGWQVATLAEIRQITPDFYTLVLKVDGWRRHVAGQHYDVRLTAEGGYQAERSYSIASTPEREGVVEFGVQRLPDGEVSPYLCQMAPGDRLEVKGPLGGHFVWTLDMPGPLLLVAGGSGIVPFMSMLRQYRGRSSGAPSRPVVLLHGARDFEHIPYYETLAPMPLDDPTIQVHFALSRSAPADWKGLRGRIGPEILRLVLSPFVDQLPMLFVCGSTPFVEAIANSLVDLGFPSHTIKTERFGGTTE